MKVPDWFVLAIALVRAQERGHTITDAEVLDACDGWGVTPGPVMIIVRGKAPRRALQRLTTSDGSTLINWLPSADYVYMAGDNVWTNTPDMQYARWLRHRCLDILGSTRIYHGG